MADPDIVKTINRNISTNIWPIDFDKFGIVNCDAYWPSQPDRLIKFLNSDNPIWRTVAIFNKRAVLSQRWPRDAPHNLYECPESFWDSLTAPMDTFPKLFDASPWTCSRSLFTAQCTMVQSAVLLSHVVCLSVCLSVCPWIMTTSVENLGN